LNLIRKYGLDPGDSIHGAAAILERAEAIVSTDLQIEVISMPNSMKSNEEGFELWFENAEP